MPHRRFIGRRRTMNLIRRSCEQKLLKNHMCIYIYIYTSSYFFYKTKNDEILLINQTKKKKKSFPGCEKRLSGKFQKGPLVADKAETRHEFRRQTAATYKAGVHRVLSRRVSQRDPHGKRPQLQLPPINECPCRWSRSWNSFFFLIFPTYFNSFTLIHSLIIQQK